MKSLKFRPYQDRYIAKLNGVKCLQKNKDKIGKAGYSQFIGELYLHTIEDMLKILQNMT